MAKAAKQQAREETEQQVEPQATPEGYRASVPGNIPWTREWTPLYEGDHHHQPMELCPVPAVDPTFEASEVPQVALSAAGPDPVPPLLQEQAVETQEFGTETPPRQTPPHNKVEPPGHATHTPPSNADAMGRIDENWVRPEDPNTGGGGGSIEQPDVDAPVIDSLEPDEANIGDDDLTLHVTADAGLTPDCIIVFNGGDEATTFVSETELTTTVKPSTAQVPGDYPVQVRRAGKLSNILMFSFEEALDDAPTRSKRKK